MVLKVTWFFRSRSIFILIMSTFYCHVTKICNLRFYLRTKNTQSNVVDSTQNMFLNWTRQKTWMMNGYETSVMIQTPKILAYRRTIYPLQVIVPQRSRQLKPMASTPIDGHTGRLGQIQLAEIQYQSPYKFTGDMFSKI